MVSPEPNEDVIIISMCGHDNRLGEKLTFFKQEPEQWWDEMLFEKAPGLGFYIGNFFYFQFFHTTIILKQYKKDTEKPVELDVEG